MGDFHQLFTVFADLTHKERLIQVSMESIVIDGDINCRNQTKKKHKKRPHSSALNGNLKYYQDNLNRPWVVTFIIDFTGVRHLIPKWRPINYSVVGMLISPLRLSNMYKRTKEF